jgi:hypothetical protein
MHLWMVWPALLVLAAGVVCWSLCVVSARADAQAERMNHDWQQRKGDGG